MSVIGLWLRMQVAVWISRYWTRFYGRINAPVIWGIRRIRHDDLGPIEACYLFVTLLRPVLINCPLIHTLHQVIVILFRFSSLFLVVFPRASKDFFLKTLTPLVIQPVLPLCRSLVRSRLRGRLRLRP